MASPRKSPLKYNGKNRVAYAKGVLRIQDSLAAKWRTKIYAEIMRTNRELSASYKLTRTSRFEDIRQEHEDNLKDLFRQMARETARRFAPAAVSGVKRNVSALLEEDAIDYAATQSLLRVAGASKRTIDIARRIISTGLAAGKSIAEIGKDLESNAAALTARSRGTTIARTEIHSAANVSSHKLAMSTGVKLNREWISTNDDRVRHDHSSADGQTVGMDGEFEVGGESLLFPGDPNGSPENVINCRCVVGYVAPDGD